jgi:hypothetical protein
MVRISFFMIRHLTVRITDDTADLREPEIASPVSGFFSRIA